MKIEEDLSEDEAGAHNLEDNILVLLEGVLGPALHCESLNASPVNLVRVVLISKSEVGVSHHSNDHAEEHVVEGLVQGHHTSEGKKDWG